MAFHTQILSVGDPIRGEATNVAVVVFDAAGQRVASMAGDPARAYKRGNWLDGWQDLGELVRQYTDGSTTLDLARSGYPATIHWRDGGGSIQVDAKVVLQQTYDRFVADPRPAPAEFRTDRMRSTAEADYASAATRLADNDGEPLF